jgi:hypothetical protein
VRRASRNGLRAEPRGAGRRGLHCRGAAWPPASPAGARPAGPGRPALAVARRRSPRDRAPPGSVGRYTSSKGAGMAAGMAAAGAAPMGPARRAKRAAWGVGRGPRPARLQPRRRRGVAWGCEMPDGCRHPCNPGRRFKCTRSNPIARPRRRGPGGAARAAGTRGRRAAAARAGRPPLVGPRAGARAGRPAERGAGRASFSSQGGGAFKVEVLRMGAGIARARRKQSGQLGPHRRQGRAAARARAR